MVLQDPRSSKDGVLELLYDRWHGVLSIEYHRKGRRDFFTLFWHINFMAVSAESDEILNELFDRCAFKYTLAIVPLQISKYECFALSDKPLARLFAHRA